MDVPSHFQYPEAPSRKPLRVVAPKPRLVSPLTSELDEPAQILDLESLDAINSEAPEQKMLLLSKKITMKRSASAPVSISSLYHDCNVEASQVLRNVEASQELRNIFSMSASHTSSILAEDDDALFSDDEEEPPRFQVDPVRNRSKGKARSTSASPIQWIPERPARTRSDSSLSLARYLFPSH